MAFRSLFGLRSKLLNFSNLTRESSADGQTFIQSFFQRTVVDGAPAFVFNNDFVRFLNFGRVETENAEAAISVEGEDANIINFANGSIEADSGPDAQATAIDVSGSAAIRNFGAIDGEFNGVSFSGPQSSGQLDNFRGGRISSDSRAVNIQGDGVSVRNFGEIVGTGDQRNGTIYTDGSADDFSIRNFRDATIDAGEGNQGAGISLEIGDEAGETTSGTITNNFGGTIQGRGQAASNTALAGDGIRVNNGEAGTTFDGNIVNSGFVSSESNQGTTAGLRVADGVAFDGAIVNTSTGVIEGARNGLYIGNAEHDLDIVNAGTIQSGSRAVNIDGSNVDLVNNGRILGTGDQRNGTVYADDTATDYSITNGRGGTIDAGAGNNGAGVSLSLAEDGNGEVDVVNAGKISGRGQASAADGTAGDGIRLEGVRVDGGFGEALFDGTIVNSGEVTSESTQGTTGAFRSVNNVNFQGTLVNEQDGVFAGANNGVYFGTGDHTGGAFVNQGLVSSDSRAVNVDGAGLTVANEGRILGTGDQRNGTVYADDTATDYTIANGQFGSIDAGEGNNGAGISLSLAEGGNGDVVVDNAGTIAGRGQASPAGGTAGDGIRLEGARVDGGFAEALFGGRITNTGTVTSESNQGTTGAFRAVNNVNFRGQLVNEQGGVFAGANNGVYFGTGDHTGGEFTNRGLVTSDSRAVNIDGSGLTVVNEGRILGTGDQRNGTVYADGTADNYTLVNAATGVIDAGEGNNGSGVALQTGDVVGDVVNANVLNEGVIQGRGGSDSANLVGNGVRVFAGDDVADTTSLAGNIVNDGLIAGSADSSTAAGISIESGVDILGAIINTGEIRGVENAIDARDGGSVNLVNDGVINGNVLLGDDNDIVISSQGTVNGVIDGGAGDDVVLAGAEDNVLVGGLGNDILIGGDGVDTARFDDLDVGIVANLQSGTVSRDGFAADVAAQALVNPNQGVTNNLAPAAILSAAIAGNIYFNVHTSAFPSGEVRGQLELVSDVSDGHGTRTVTLNAALDGDQEVPAPVDSPATGTASVVFTVSEAGEISYETDLDVSNLQGDLLPVNIGNGTLSPIHLHNAPAGENGPVVVDVASDAGEGLVIVDETDVLIDVENIVGSGGDDLVVASEFSDITGVVDGGDGLDTLDFSDFTSGISVDLDLNTPQPGPASQDGALVTQVGPNGEVIQEFDNFENVIGSNFDDVIFGNNEINVLEGGAGNDLIHSFGGADVLDGGEGIDTALFSASPVGVTVDLDEDGNALSSFGDSLIAFENVNGSVAGDDDIAGNSGANVLNGQGGNDTLTGEGGDDVLIGGSGQDIFVFAFGSDDDAVSDFEDGQDRLDVGGFGHDFDIGGAIAGAVQDGGDTVITLSDTDSVRLAGFDVADLNEQDFIA